MDSISNTDFLQSIFCGLDDDEIVVVSSCLGDPKDHHWSISSDPGIATDRANNYFCISTVKQQTGRLKRTKDELVRVHVIPLDDIGTKGSGRLLPTPTYEIETSPGNYQWGYVLAEPLEDLNEAQTLVKLMSRAADEGAPIPNKLIRLPVGVNGKAEYGDPSPACRLISLDPDLTFDVDELCEAFDISIDEWNETYDRIAATEPEPGKVAAGAPVHDDLFTWLNNAELITSSAPDANGFFDMVCPWQHLHTTGESVARFSPLGCGGKHAGYQGFKCFHGHCEDRNIRDLHRWYFHERFVYESRNNWVLDKQFPDLIYRSKEHFRTYTSTYDLGKDHRPALQWLSRADRMTVHGLQFYPGAARVYTDLLSGIQYFNPYVPPKFDHTSSHSLIQPIIDHVDYLFKEEADNALAFLAHTVHEPHVRAKFALLHISPHEGTGRGWLKLLMSRLVGRDYVSMVDVNHWADGKFNGYLASSLLVMFDEIFDEDNKYSMADRLREVITEDFLEIREKYQHTETKRIFPNMTFFTNRLNALKLQDSDRRFWIVVNQDQPRPQEVYEELYALLDSPEAMAQFYWFLHQQLSTSTLDISGRAPKTIWRDSVIGSGHDEFEDAVRSAVKQMRALGHEAVWRSHIINDAAALGCGPIVDNTKESKRLVAILNEMGIMRTDTRKVRTEGARQGSREFIYLLSPALNHGHTVPKANLAQKDMMAKPLTVI